MINEIKRSFTSAHMALVAYL